MLASAVHRALFLRILRSEKKILSTLIHVDSRHVSTDPVVVEKSEEEIERQHFNTGVLLLHHGQPRTPFYAKEYIARSASQYHAVPQFVAKFFVNLLWPFWQKVQYCVADYEHSELLTSQMGQLSQSLECALGELVPEFGHIRCSAAFQYEKPEITRQLKQLVSDGIKRIVLLPMYPHYSCWQTGTMFMTAIRTLYGDVTVLDKFLSKSKRASSNMLSTDPVVISAVYRWNTHPFLLSFWQQAIKEKLANHDSILFVAPQMFAYGDREYHREVWSSCERIIERMGNAYPWRVAFYSGWNQWPVINPETITWQLHLFRREKKERTMVVPVTAIFPSFDTEAVLPNILVNKGVDFVPPPTFSPTLVHGFAELVKNQLLGGGFDAQLSNRCPMCINPRCEYTKRMLAESSRTVVSKPL